MQTGEGESERARERGGVRERYRGRQRETEHDRDSARTVSAVHANQKVCCNKYSIYV